MGMDGMELKLQDAMSSPVRDPYKLGQMFQQHMIQVRRVCMAPAPVVGRCMCLQSEQPDSRIWYRML
jgi:hypothetical protein